MRIALAYLCVTLLWATTPLAIKWSGEGPGFLFGAMGRMLIGVVCISGVLLIMKQPLPWHRKACMTYLAVTLQIYGSMILVYWAAQFIPSGWISVLFGLTPLITALLARLWLGQNELNFSKLLIDPALKSMKPFALSLSKGQYTQGLRQAQPERS